MNGNRVVYALTLPTIVLLLTGCNRPAPSEKPAALPPGTVQLERVPEAEAVLEQLGRKAWAFKYGGGELTAEMAVFHRPAGADQKEKTVYQVNGDQAFEIVHSAPKGEYTQADAQGYLIVCVPELSANREGAYTFNLSLGGGACSREAKASDVEPKTAENSPRSATGGALFDKSTTLSPGETKTLIDRTMHIVDPKAKVPVPEMEAIRVVVTATALKDGKLPERNPAR